MVYAKICAMMPATAEEPAALAYLRMPAVQSCNPIYATAGMQDVISRARLKLFSTTSDIEGGCVRLEKPLAPENSPRRTDCVP